MQYFTICSRLLMDKTPKYTLKDKNPKKVSYTRDYKQHQITISVNEQITKNMHYTI